MTQYTRASFLGLLFITAAAAQEVGLAGHYEGTIEAPDREINIIVHLDRDAKQAWIGHITLTPGPSEFPLTGITLKGDAVTFTLQGVPNAPQFEGKWDKGAKTITGTATGGGNSVPFTLTRKGDPKVAVPKQSSVLPKEFAAEWEGAIQAGTQTLRLLLALKPDAEGRATAVLTSLDQNNAQIPVSSVSIEGDTLIFEVKLVAGRFEGKANADKNEIVGTWTQGPNNMPLTLKKKGAEATK
jgi:hypothetical protein